MEGGALVAETVLASGKLAEVASRFGDNVVVEGEVDAASAGYEGAKSASIFDDD